MWFEMAARQTLLPALLLGSLLAMLAIVAPPILPSVEPVGVLIVAGILVLALTQARGTMLVLALALILPALGLMLRGGFAPLGEAVADSLRLCGFLTALHLLRAVATVSDTLETVRRRCRALEPDGRRVAALLGGFSLGSFLHVGAHAVLAPILTGGADASEPARRTVLATAAVRGLSLSALWSPFFVGVVFVVQQVPGASLGAVMASGLTIAFSVGAALVLATPGLRAGFVPAARALSGLAAPMVLLFAFFWGLQLVSGLGGLEVLTLGIPLLLGTCLLAMPGGKQGAVLRAAGDSLRGGSDEVMIVIAATLLSSTLETEIGGLADQLHWLATLSPTVLIGAIIVAMIGLGVLGVHQFISASVILAAAYAMPQLDPVDFAAAVVIGWSFAAASSPVGTSIMVASRMFEVPFRALVFWKPLVGTLAIAAYATLVLGLV